MKILNLEKVFDSLLQCLESLGSLLFSTNFLWKMQVALMLRHFRVSLEKSMFLLLDIHVHKRKGWKSPLFLEETDFDKEFLQLLNYFANCNPRQLPFYRFWDRGSCRKGCWPSSDEQDDGYLSSKPLNIDFDFSLAFVTLTNFSISTSNFCPRK